MLHTITQVLDWFGICVFAMSGGLMASRKQMDIVGFCFLGSAAGVGGGTLRDLLLGSTPVFWLQRPEYLLTCVLVAVATFFVAHLVQSRLRWLIWSDAVGLALFCVTGTQAALAAGAGNIIAIAMGVVTATFGGVIRDLLSGEIPVILHREIYATAALVGASTCVLARYLGANADLALIGGFVAALALRSAAIAFDLSLPVFKVREGR